MRLYCFYRISLIALISFFLLKADAENTFDSVKIISLKNGNCVLCLIPDLLHILNFKC